jgi:hypothetical protein
MATNPSSGSIVLARLFWLVAGPATLLLLAAVIAGQGNGWFAPVSIVFLVILVGLVFARRLDPHDSFGEPTTPAGLQTYSVGTIGTGFVLWIVANLIGNT